MAVPSIENPEDLLTDQKVEGLRTFCSECI